MTTRNDYAGAFDPKLGLAGFSRGALASLGREYLLNGHLQDRVGLPLVAKQFGGERVPISDVPDPPDPPTPGDDPYDGSNVNFDRDGVLWGPYQLKKVPRT